MNLDLNKIAVEMVREYGTHVNLTQTAKLTGKDARTIKTWVSTGNFPEQCTPGYWSTTKILEFTHSHETTTNEMTADEMIFKCNIPESPDTEYWRNKLNN